MYISTTGKGDSMNTVVYYPYINPKPDWLKLAALCWDKVYRLAPSYDWPNDSGFGSEIDQDQFWRWIDAQEERLEEPELQELKELDETFGGILEPANAQEFGSKIQDQFLRWIDAREERIQDQFWRWIDAREERFEELGLQELEWVFEGPLKGGPFGLFDEKLPTGDFIRKLEERGLAHVELESEEGRIQLSEASKRADHQAKELLRQAEELRNELSMAKNKLPREAEELLWKVRKLRWAARGGKSKQAEALEKKAEEKYPGTVKHIETLEKKAIALESEAEKITERVRPELAIAYLPRDVALHYLSLCALQVAKDEKRDLVADAGKFTDAVFHDYSISGEVATTVLQAYLPEGFFSLEPQQIAEFRSLFSAKRLKYQTTVQEIVDKYSAAASVGQLEAVKKDITEIARAEVEETRRAYQRAKQEMVIKTLRMSLTPPAIATFIGSALGIGIFAPAGIVAALSLFGTSLLLDFDKAEKDRAKSPWSYVLDAAKLR